jgi:biopolymer transport protein ExbD
MTSLIDVIFLLLLFFMLSSTFTRFAEIDLAAAGTGGAAGEKRPVFLQLRPDIVQLNGRAHDLGTLGRALEALREEADQPLPVIVALRADPTAQRLTDLLVVLRSVPDLSVTVLEAR